MALGLYTALPGFARWDDDCSSWLAAMLPAVGLILGGIWWVISAWATSAMPQALRAAVIALSAPVLTGFLHLDGYMDVADALLSSRPQGEKLRILKDPHTGAFSVIALAMLFLLAYGASQSILAEGSSLAMLVLLPVLSRALAGFAIMTLRPMAQSGYGKMNYEAATNGRRFFCVFCYCLALGASFLAGWRGGLVCLLATASFVLFCFIPVRSLGGMNGDIAGCSICCCEVAGLMAMACLL